MPRIRCDRRQLSGKVLPLGNVQYIKPSARFPDVRLRFTPAKGLVNGASDQGIEIDQNGNQFAREDKIVSGRVTYDGANKQHKWLGCRDGKLAKAREGIAAGLVFPSASVWRRGPG